MSGCNVKALVHASFVLIAAGLICAFSVAGQVPPASGEAAEFLTTSWHTENGLPDGNVTAIAQTPDGYLWVGTFRGLARFDGARFVAFDGDNDAGFLRERIGGLLVDSQGRLWVAGDGGELGYFQKGKFVQVTTTGALTNEVKTGAAAGTKVPMAHSTHSRGLAAASLAEDASGTVWLRLGAKAMLAVREGMVRYVTATNGLPKGEVLALVPDARRLPWLLTTEGTFQWSTNGWRNCETRRGLPPEQSVAGVSRKNGFWLAVPHIVSGSDSGRIIHVPDIPGFRYLDQLPSLSDLQRSRVTAVLEDQSGRLWIGTHWGGVLYADEAGHWRPIGSAGPLAQSRVLSLFEGDLGAIWVGTLGEGLHRLTPRAIRTLPLPGSKRDFLITTVCAGHDGGVWVGTDTSGIFRFRDGNWTRFGAETGMEGNPVYSILEDRETNVWCGVGNQLMQFEAGRFKRFPEPELNAGLAIALFEDRQGGLWVGTPRGPVLRKAGKTSLRPLDDTLQTVEIRSFGQDSAGNIWVGTIGQGVFCLLSNRVERFGPKEGLSNPDARSIWCGANGGVLVGTLGDGVFRFQDGRFHHLGAADGLPDETIHGMTEDQEGSVWFTTYNGLFGCSFEELSNYRRGRTPGLSCRWFSVKDGLEFRACSGAGQPVISLAGDGRIWFINQSSLAVLDSQAGVKRGRTRRLLVESVVVDGVKQAIPSESAMKVPSQFHRLEIQYTSPDLLTPTTLRFRYRLHPYEDDWVEAGERRVAFYNRLPPGHYLFEIMTGGPGENWRQWSRNFGIEVVPRFYELRSVQIGGALACLGLLVGTVWVAGRARLHRRLERLEAQNATERERQRIAQDLHDDLGTSLTEINLLSTLARSASASPEQVRTGLEGIAEKSHEMVKALDEIVWAVNPRNDSLPRLVNYLCLFVQEFLEATPIRVRLDVPSELPSVPLNADQRHTLYLVVKEAVANVAKHSQASEVRLRVKCGDELELVIEDNGRGFDPAQAKPDRNGLANLQERMTRVGGRCVLVAAPGKGTSARFTLPLPPMTKAAEASPRFDMEIS